MLRVARYRFQTTFRQRRGGNLALVLLIGLVGGLAIGVAAAARRTQSSFPRFLAATNPSDLYSNAFLNPTPDGKLVLVARTAHVTKFESQADLAVGPVQLNGAPPRAATTGEIALRSIDGLGFDQDRVSIATGRMADPKRADDFVMTALGVQRPAEIVDYRSMGNTPAYLGAALGAGAVVALALTLIATVRRRRRDLALLKTLGFTRGQLATVVAWQSSVAVAVGTVVGIPVGIVVGCWTWTLFAHTINVVPNPTVPSLTICLVAVGALVLANVVAALAGRQAARTRTALLLRAE